MEIIDISSIALAKNEKGFWRIEELPNQENIYIPIDVTILFDGVSTDLFYGSIITGSEVAKHRDQRAFFFPTFCAESALSAIRSYIMANEHPDKMETIKAISKKLRWEYEGEKYSDSN